jgi:hypothetical protein
MARKMARLYGEPLPKSCAQVHYWVIPLKALTFRRPSSIGKVTGRPFVAGRRAAGAQSGD